MEELNEKLNLERLDKRILELNLNSEVVIAFDFDELVVPVHLTRIVTQKISKPLDESKLDALGSSSFEGIKYLNELSIDQDYNSFKKLCDDMSRETPWREGFKDLIQKDLKNYSVIVISSGMKDVSISKLKEINFPERNVFGGEYLVVDGKIKGSRLVISGKLKGYIVGRIKEKHKVISVGHSSGDKYMLSESDVSIALNPSEEGLAQFSVKSAGETLETIKQS